MSYCVNIITEMQLDPMDILRKVASKDQCRQIITTSKEFPTIKFGTFNEALRGIEVNKEDNGYEVRICSCSSRADYELFPITIDVLIELTGAVAITEDEETIDNPYLKYNDDWIEKEIETGWDVICTLLRHNGGTITMYGLFLPFCVGPRMLLERNISLFPPFDNNKAGYNWLTKYFTLIQWSLANGKDTSSRLAIPDSSNPENDPLGISMIAIKNNELNEFDYVSTAPLMGMFNLDTNDSVIIRFEDFRKAINTTDMMISHLVGIDECQMRVCSGEVCGGKADLKEIVNIMDTARRYVPTDVTYRPSYPGSGYDEKQNTFILMWNPDNSGLTLNEYVESIKRFYVGPYSRRVHEWEKAKMDDRFYIIKTGDGKTGVVMAGVFSSQPYLSTEGSKKGRRQHYIELEPSMMLNPDTTPMLTIDILENTITDFMWRGGYSGRMLTNEQARLLETLYGTYLKTIKHSDDGINLCIIERF